MEYNVTGFNNFCRVFELPAEFSNGYCFGGGIPTLFKMVDWFNPIPELPQWGISEEKYNQLIASGDLVDSGDHKKTVNSEDVEKQISDFISQKIYIKKDRDYIVICKFGLTFMIKK